MANTYTLIASSTVGAGGASTIAFSSIPSTYMDLVVKLSARANNSGTDCPIVITFNGSTSGYTDKAVYGTGSAAGSVNTGTGAGIYWNYQTGNTATSNTFGNGDIYIPNYAGSAYKSVSIDTVSENNGTAAFTMLTAALWSNTAAINSITFTPNSASFLQYTTAYLYGIKNS
jgi:hypothetical protein